MRALVVGLGSIGRRHARNWAALGEGELIVCRQFGAAQPEPLGVDAREFSDLRRALAEQPDVVFVTNPTSLHVATARAALDAGAHLFIEKPIGHSLEGVQDLLLQARDTSRTIAVGYNLRFHPGLARMRDLIVSGAIGRPLTARFEMGEFLPGWHPWEDYRHAYSGRHDLGGGPILTFSHELDSLCWLLGRPTRVTAFAAHASDLEIDTEDVAEIVVELASGIVASVHVDYVRRPPRRLVEVVGSDGVLRWEYDANRLLQYAPATREWRIEEGDPTFNRNQMYEAELRRFVDWLEGGPPEPLSTAEQAAGVLALALAARQSAAEGRAVDLSSVDGSDAAWFEQFDRRERAPA